MFIYILHAVKLNVYILAWEPIFPYKSQQTQLRIFKLYSKNMLEFPNQNLKEISPGAHALWYEDIKNEFFIDTNFLILKFKNV